MTNKRILIAEDEIIIAMDIKNMLRRNGFENISTFTDGEEILKEAYSTPPDIIIADIILKNKSSGTNTAEKVWEKYDIPFLFISAIEMGNYRKKYNDKRCEFLKKPFKEGDLMEMLNKLLKRET